MSVSNCMSEPALSTQLREMLEPHFWVLPEVWLADHSGGPRVRIDYLAWPRTEDFRLSPCGFEVKRADCDRGMLIRALKQCVDYRRATIIDKRCPRTQGQRPVAVFLWRGATRRQMRVAPSCAFRPGAIRLAGKFNVGEAVFNPWDGLQLLISDEPLWSARRGTSGVGQTWPTQRLIANSRTRAI